jgi:4,5-dihydroxyphthalate decarboxylase
MDGRVKTEGCEVSYIPMPVEELFRRAYFHQEFDVAEIGFSPFLISLSRGTAPEGKSLVEMLAEGELDAVMTARAPSCFINGHPNVVRLYEDFRAAEKEYYARTTIFPIMHALGIRNDLAEEHPWLPASVFKAFVKAKRIADAELREVAALKITLPWLRAELESTIEVMGEDFWPYRVEANRHTLETMSRYSFEQGLAVKQLTVEQMFAELALSETKVWEGSLQSRP